MDNRSNDNKSALDDARIARNTALWTVATGFTGISSDNPVGSFKKGDLRRALLTYLLVGLLAIPIVGGVLYFMVTDPSNTFGQPSNRSVIILIAAVVLVICLAFFIQKIIAKISKRQPPQTPPAGGPPSA